MMDETKIREGISALYGCREVLGSIANIQHAIDCLESLLPDNPHKHRDEPRTENDTGAHTTQNPDTSYRSVFDEPAKP